MPRKFSLCCTLLAFDGFNEQMLGICGLLLTGLIAGIAMYALRTALAEREKG